MTVTAASQMGANPSWNWPDSTVSRLFDSELPKTPDIALGSVHASYSPSLRSSLSPSSSSSSHHKPAFVSHHYRYEPASAGPIVQSAMSGADTQTRSSFAVPNLPAFPHLCRLDATETATTIAAATAAAASTANTTNTTSTTTPPTTTTTIRCTGGDNPYAFDNCALYTDPLCHTGANTVTVLPALALPNYTNPFGHEKSSSQATTSGYVSIDSHSEHRLSGPDQWSPFQVLPSIQIPSVDTNCFMVPMGGGSPVTMVELEQSSTKPSVMITDMRHQWDIKDVKLPKVNTYDSYDQWPTGHCRRVYPQSCERARRHQSGWAMRNTNNHNPQVLKKSCLGVLECSVGCLVQGKPLSLRPAICDKARKKQTNRPCITPGCPGRLTLRNCRGHSGYPVTHFWRFANGAVYFEAKGEHDHNRPSLKTFGLSEVFPSSSHSSYSSSSSSASLSPSSSTGSGLSTGLVSESRATLMLPGLVQPREMTSNAMHTTQRMSGLFHLPMVSSTGSESSDINKPIGHHLHNHLQHHHHHYQNQPRLLGRTGEGKPKRTSREKRENRGLLTGNKLPRLVGTKDASEALAPWETASTRTMLGLKRGHRGVRRKTTQDRELLFHPGIFPNVDMSSDHSALDQPTTATAAVISPSTEFYPPMWESRVHWPNTQAPQFSETYPMESCVPSSSHCTAYGHSEQRTTANVQAQPLFDDGQQQHQLTGDHSLGVQPELPNPVSFQSRPVALEQLHNIGAVPNRYEPGSPENPRSPRWSSSTSSPLDNLTRTVSTATLCPDLPQCINYAQHISGLVQFETSGTGDYSEMAIDNYQVGVDNCSVQQGTAYRRLDSNSAPISTPSWPVESSAHVNNLSENVEYGFAAPIPILSEHPRVSSEQVTDFPGFYNYTYVASGRSNSDSSGFPTELSSHCSASESYDDAAPLPSTNVDVNNLRDWLSRDSQTESDWNSWSYVDAIDTRGLNHHATYANTCPWPANLHITGGNTDSHMADTLDGNDWFSTKTQSENSSFPIEDTTNQNIMFPTVVDFLETVTPSLSERISTKLRFVPGSSTLETIDWPRMETVSSSPTLTFETNA